MMILQQCGTPDLATHQNVSQMHLIVFPEILSEKIEHWKECIKMLTDESEEGKAGFQRNEEVRNTCGPFVTFSRLNSFSTGRYSRKCCFKISHWSRIRSKSGFPTRWNKKQRTRSVRIRQFTKRIVVFNASTWVFQKGMSISYEIFLKQLCTLCQGNRFVKRSISARFFKMMGNFMIFFVILWRSIEIYDVLWFLRHWQACERVPW